MVQMARVAEIRKAWRAAGCAPCDHQNTAKEYELSSQTGDIACLDCGASWWSSGPPPSQEQNLAL